MAVADALICRGAQADQANYCLGQIIPGSDVDQNTQPHAIIKLTNFEGPRTVTFVWKRNGQEYFTWTGEIPAGDGIKHRWGNPYGKYHL